MAETQQVQMHQLHHLPYSSSSESSPSPYEPWYSSLVGLADHFYQQNPPNIKSTIQCLQAIFHYKPSPQISARTCFQIGKILSNLTSVAEDSIFHLERTWQISQNYSIEDEVKYEAVSLCSKKYLEQNKVWLARTMLKTACDQSTLSPYWHTRFIFQLAQLEMYGEDKERVLSILEEGFNFSSLNNLTHSQLLFILSKIMILLMNRQMQLVDVLLSQALSLLESWLPSNHSMSQSNAKALVEVFYLVLKVVRHLLDGQVKTVRPHLKQLQQTIQNVTTLSFDESLTSSCSPDLGFRWLNKDLLCILVYLVTVMHSMEAGHVEKAQKYIDKAFVQVDKFKTISSELDLMLTHFRALLLEHIIMCRLVTGQKSLSIQHIVQLGNLCSLHLPVFHLHRPTIHMLIGLYAMSCNCLSQAETQFKLALNQTNDIDLNAFISLNLALIYVRNNQHHSLEELLQKFQDPNYFNNISYSMKVSSLYIKGMQAFFQSRSQEASKFLKEGLKLSKSEDINRLTAFILVILGHVFFKLGNTQESISMVATSMQLSTKIPDFHIQLWATTVLKDLYRMIGDPQREAENASQYESLSQKLLQDLCEASQTSGHSLIQWVDGPFPFYIPQQSQIRLQTTNQLQSPSHVQQQQSSLQSQSENMSQQRSNINSIQNASQLLINL